MFTKFSTSTTLRFFDFAIQLAERWIRFVNCWPRFSFHLRQPAIIASIALMFYWFSYSLFAIFSHSFSCAKFKKTKKIFRKHRLFMLKKSNSFYYCYQFVHNISDGFLFGMQYAYFLLVSKRASEMIIGKLASISIIFIEKMFFSMCSLHCRE